MGNNVPCISGDRGESFPPTFVAPNSRGVKFSFDYTVDNVIKLGTDQRDVSPLGFLLDSRPHSAPAKRYTAKDGTSQPHRVRLCVAGRVLTTYPDPTGTPAQRLPPAPGHTNDGMTDAGCIFKVCTRSRPIFESVRTPSFTHTAQVVDAGVACAVSMGYMGGQLFLLPRISLVLESGDEVLLVEDQLGPLTAPSAFCVDFAFVDDGGRNVQLDLILREAAGAAVPTKTGGTAPLSKECVMRGRTVRTCLQEYTTFNSQVKSPSVSFGYSSLVSLSKTVTAHLQNMVISEEAFDEPVPEPQPYEAWRESAIARRGAENKGPPSRILFEGFDARAAAGPGHPQLLASTCRTTRAGPRRPVPPLCDTGALSVLTSKGTKVSSADSFWHHIRYSDGDTAEGGTSAEDADSSHFTGEFWLSKYAVEEKGVYFHCSCTLAQALSMCIIFRFSCPTDYLFLIENQRKLVLLDTHIPTNGIVLGVEADPRHNSLIRMFLEHRNEIVEDMAVCECSRAVDLERTLVDHEVYDSGGHIVYRLTILHRSGERQSAVLQIDATKIEERTASNLLSMDTSQPSLRFPVTPSLARHNLSPASRIFVYTSRAFFDEDPSADVDEGTATARDDSIGSVEEWESIGEPETEFGACSSYPGTANSVKSASDFADASDALATKEALEERASPAWRRPLIDSAVVIGGLEEPPFRCFPAAMT